MLKIPPYIRVLASTLAIVALLLACVLSFHNMLSKALRGEAESRLVDGTNRSRDLISKRIENQWGAMSTAAAFLQPGAVNTAVLQRLQMSNPELRDLRQFGAVTVDGRLLYGYRMPPDCLYLLQETFRGQNRVAYIENLLPFDLMTSEGLLFSVPVWHNGKVAGAVYGMLTEQAMAQIFASGDAAAPGWLFSSAGDFHKIILSSDKAGLDHEVVEMLRSDAGKTLRQDIEWQLYYNKAGTERFDYGGESYYLSAVPLPPLDGWYLDSIIPTQHVDQTLNRILIAASVVNLVFALMLIFAFWSYNRSERENAQAVERLAYQDQLTGLWNWEGMQRAVRRQKPVGEYDLLVLDFNGFSLINSIMGHEYGNQLLQQTAALLRAAAVPAGLACRVGADRFLVCLQKQDDLLARAEDLMQWVQDASTGYALTVACGIAAFEPGLSLPHVFEHCLAALKIAKKCKGPRQLAVFDLRLEIESKKSKSLEADFVTAVEQGDIQFYVQPVTEQPSGRLLSLEALAHWEHSRLGLIRSDWFVPVLEEIGQLQKLDLYMLESVCHWLATRKAEGKSLLPVSVNLSPVHFASDASAQRLADMVRQHALAFSLIQLELPARIFQLGSEPLIKRLNALHELGFGVIVDDFGDGYVPFQILGLLHIDMIKLDRANLHDLPHGHQLLEEFCHFAQRLLIPVVIKGIETQEQVDCLREMAPYNAQGYMYGRPMSIQTYEQQEAGKP